MRSCLALLLWVAAIPSLWGQTLTRGTPAEVSLSAETLQEGVRLFKDAVDRDELRGAVLLVARNGKIVLHEALGWRDKDKMLPMQKDTLFHVASNTKPVIAMAILLLAEEGKLSLDDPVGKHLAAFNNEKCKAITIRHLLNHTSGFRLPSLFVLPLMEKSKDHPDAPNLQLEVNRFPEIGPKEKPGTTYSYSNPGYNTLGAIIEVVGKQPLEKFLQENIYQPLGMKDSGHRDLSREQVERRAVIYRRKDGNWSIQGDAPVPFVRASGGMISTAEDYARFCQVYLNEGVFDGKRYLKAETVKMATSAQTKHTYTEEELKKTSAFYGCGWMVAVSGRYAHAGSDGTFAWVDPKEKIIGLVFTQSPGGRLQVNEFMEKVQQAVLPAKGG